MKTDSITTTSTMTEPSEQALNLEPKPLAGVFSNAWEPSPENWDLREKWQAYVTQEPDLNSAYANLPIASKSLEAMFMQVCFDITEAATPTTPPKSSPE